MDNKNLIASRDALTDKERAEWMVSRKIRMICEGDLNCKNQIELTKEEVIDLNNQSKSILCNTCEPRYGHLRRDENTELGFNDIGKIL